ncbi:hypothetical protein [Bacteroides gallinarum]|uniref:hypothetical protein n=1 Tax=Bacteroides gallinarum TaxID=376806 RepID=UPI00036A7832|nr:hypothetical protein [Bacteroides gallinarum]
MDKSKLYETQESENQMVNEAAMMYEVPTRSVDDFIASIPVDSMQRLIDVAIRDCKAGKGIPHNQIASYINEKMGWK